MHRESLTTKPEYDVEAILGGDHSAFEHMVRVESPRLFRAIDRIVQDDSEAASLLQETFLQAWKNRGAFRRESLFSTWLFAIAINQSKKALRHLSRSAPLTEEDLDRMQPGFTMGMWAQPVEEWRTEQPAEREDLRRLVHEGIDRLPADARTVVMLRDIEELSTSETASVLGISPGAVRVRLHRARQTLRAILAPHLRIREDLG